MTTKNDLLRQLPSIDKLLQESATTDLIIQYGHDAVVSAFREMLDSIRAQIQTGTIPEIQPEPIILQAREALQRHFLPTLRPVINATGVVIHTNLGRALLSDSAQKAILTVAANYNNLEFNLETGKRGSRYLHAEELLKELTGAEAALVVNNNASALVLVLAALAKDKSVIISRGQLVEIGGGFRIPDVMIQSGARLLEVGTTNRTRIADYASAIQDDTALLMRIHSSNFRIVGFVESASIEEMALLAHEKNLYFVDDVGSGALFDTAQYGMLHEPTVTESVAAGADLVLFSGDKLLGGPQAGIIVGRYDLIQLLKKHPLARALRADKLAYAALNATLDHYRRGEAKSTIPVWQMISASIEDLTTRAENWAKQIGGAVIAGESAVGGGSTPGTTLPTSLVVLDVPSPEIFAARLRDAAFPVIVRIADGHILLDPRTVLPRQDSHLLDTLKQLL